MERKISILGTEYTIKTDNSLANINADGMCKEYEKLITIRDMGKMLDAEDDVLIKSKRFKEVLRHELTHALFDESGLTEYSNDEQLVNWIAKQFPKMIQLFREADCL